jgi:ketosteroid isomerase-like protein
VIPFVDNKDKEKDKKFPKQASAAPQDSESDLSSDRDELHRRLQSEMRRPKPSNDAMAAALEVVQRMAAEIDAEDDADDLAEATGQVCRVCGHRNREGHKFCSMCGLPVNSDAEPKTDLPQKTNLSTQPTSLPQPAFEEREPDPRSAPTRGPTIAETHHYHHHYHHHFFPGGQESPAPRMATADSEREADKLRATAALRGESMSRAEAAVRRVTQEWVLACNTKHLDDLLDLYGADSLVLRSNYPPIRGASAVREFFFGGLDAGLGEAEVEPIRVEIAGDVAYEAGRCKALVPGAAGKRREERGKYVWVLMKQSNGDWKIAVDCWSSDLTLTALESDITPTAAARPGTPRKTV